MRKIAVVAAIALATGTIGVISAASAAPASPAMTPARTLQFDVVFSPFFYVDTKPNGPSKGDTSVFHDRLFSDGKAVGDEGGSCIVVDLPTDSAAPIPINCTVSIRLAGGQITAQGLTSSAPTKQLAVTGGTGTYQNAGGQATLVEFGNGRGSLSLDLIS
jgi:hypothetical protein